MKDQFKGTLALSITTIIWGSAFIAQSVGMDYIGPFTFQTFRSVLAVLFMIPLSFLFDLSKKEGKQFFTKWNNKQLWKAGIICGITLFIASDLQQMGLVHTSAGKAGFIGAMYIVLVPIIGLFLGRKPPLSAWVSVAIAVVGLYLLSCAGVTEVNIGDILIVFSAMAYAVQITCVDRFAPDLDGVRLNCIQCLVCAILSAVVMLFAETPDWENITACTIPLIYAGVVSMGIAYSLQIIGQKYLPPTPASLIMSLESVVAGICGWLFLQETMVFREIIGCCMVFSAVILTQIPTKPMKTR